MVEQPSGTVTLVFTDIEGSTRLLRELGQDPYGEALAAHRRIVREACASRRGYEVDYEGDSFFLRLFVGELMLSRRSSGRCVGSRRGQSGCASGSTLASRVSIRPSAVAEVRASEPADRWS
jgi:class 3 adenylate cyclase